MRVLSPGQVPAVNTRYPSSGPGHFPLARVCHIFAAGDNRDKLTVGGAVVVMVRSMTDESSTDYPVAFHVEYPDGPRDRGTVLVRILLAIPMAILLSLLTGSFPLADMTRAQASLAGVGLSIATALMILFRQKYPRWWFDFVLALSRFSARIGAYLLLLRDEYPSTDEQQAVHLDIALSRRGAAQPRTAADQVAAGNPALHRADGAGSGGGGDRGVQLDRDPGDRAATEVGVRVPGRVDALGVAGNGIRVLAYYRSLPTVPAPGAALSRGTPWCCIACCTGIETAPGRTACAARRWRRRAPPM